VAESGSDQEKTEDPTPQRREDFRKRGQVAQSKEIGTVLVLFAVMLTIWFLGRFFLEQIYSVFAKSFSDYLIMSVRDGDWQLAVKHATIKGLMIVGPIAVVVWLFGVASTLLQVGFITNEEAMKFDPNRLNPVEGLKKIFSLRSLVEGLKAVFKVSIVTTISVIVFNSEIMMLPKLVTYDAPQLMVYIGELIFKLVGGVGTFMIALAAFDFFFQKWDLEQKMRMTKQEVKEEHKSREGDPLVRARVRKLQRELATRRMMDDVKKADVIITNPTHIAVAIQYSASFVAPKVIAKGAGEIAEKIKKVAKELNIPIMENKPLARTMYKTLEIGQTIPRELYNAVAEVLSYVYKLKGKRA
jgi:flagellar biosynthetic protein FlhB